MNPMWADNRSPSTICSSNHQLIPFSSGTTRSEIPFEDPHSPRLAMDRTGLPRVQMPIRRNLSPWGGGRTLWTLSSLFRYQP